MKENNKFSLSAFFCSLGSKSKIFMLFLLGVPFLLVQIFTLKVYANSAVIPVVPEGLTSSGIGSSGVVPGDPSLMYYTMLIALGLKADEVYQINKADIIDSVTEALNDYDSVNDPTLGDDLQTYLEWYDNAKSQNGYINELTIPRELWDSVNKATKAGLKIKVKSETVNMTAYDFWQNYCDTNSISLNTVIDRFESPFVIYEGYYANSYYVRLCMMGCTSDIYNSDYLKSNSATASQHYFFTSSPTFGDLSNAKFNGSDLTSTYVDINSSRYFYARATDLSNFIQYGAPSVINKNIGVARPFISSKANETYDVLSKSSVINDQTGDLEGDVTMSILSYDKIKDIASDYEDSATDIPVFFPDSRLVPIDIENPDAIPDSVGIPGDTPQEIVDSLADTFDPSPAEPIVIEPFNYIDQWDPVIPIAAESPLVGLPFVMNWVAEQMQITMFLSQFSNTWLVLSTLAVASCLVGLVRIWR